LERSAVSIRECDVLPKLEALGKVSYRRGDACAPSFVPCACLGDPLGPRSRVSEGFCGFLLVCGAVCEFAGCRVEALLALG
jgi:hypothetical protein